MFSVALVGPDGAGKTTIARMVLQAAPFRLRYLYMGVNIQASNYALPSSRLIEYFRKRGNAHLAKSAARRESLLPNTNARSLTAKLWAVASLCNRVAEEWYRQILSWIYQLRGHVVLFDRHFSLDFSLDGVDATEQNCDSLLHRWLVTHCYPSPDLVIYLDAPADVLFARKGEKSVEELEKRRKAFLRKRGQNSNFIVIDATQPISNVCGQVIESMVKFCETQRCCVSRDREAHGMKKDQALPRDAFSD